VSSLGQGAQKKARDLQVWLYRRTSGRLGGKVRQSPLLLLTVTGRNSGKQYTVPLAYVQDGKDYLVTASGGGSERVPVWFANVKAKPDVTVQLRDETWQSHAEPIEQGPERDRLYGMFVAQGPNFAAYEQKTARVIPVVRLPHS
jgi:deazaflavin-dependent oxidoreductase (nitroreductase family)